MDGWRRRGGRTSVDFQSWDADLTACDEGADDLVPVKLRRGGRTLGGSLSWDQPQALTAFSKESPFGTMAVPNDVTVTRQVLAEPEAGLVDRTWATLADGTPLRSLAGGAPVTAAASSGSTGAGPSRGGKETSAMLPMYGPTT